MPVVFSNAATIGRHHSSCTVQYSTSSPWAAAASGIANSNAGRTPRNHVEIRIVSSWVMLAKRGDSALGGECSANSGFQRKGGWISDHRVRLSSMLHDPSRHEPLRDLPWDEARARATIRHIVADTEAHFSPDTYWPLHPR